MDFLSSLPLDLRICSLRGLPARSLAACEAASKSVHAAAVCEELWAALCQEVWPQGANVGEVISTSRECYRNANGWAHLKRLRREFFSIAYESGCRQPGRRVRSSAWIASFDSRAECLAVAIGEDDGRAEIVHYVDGARSWSMSLEGYHSVDDVLLPARRGQPLIVLYHVSDEGRIASLQPPPGPGLASTLTSSPIPSGNFGLVAIPGRPDHALLYRRDGVALYDLNRARMVTTISPSSPGVSHSSCRSLCADQQSSDIATMAWRVGHRSVLLRVDFRDAANDHRVASLDTHHSGASPGSCLGPAHVRAHARVNPLHLRTHHS